MVYIRHEKATNQYFFCISKTNHYLHYSVLVLSKCMPTFSYALFSYPIFLYIIFYTGIKFVCMHFYPTTTFVCDFDFSTRLGQSFEQV